jgi:Xaa-Pro aminopeptidase
MCPDSFEQPGLRLRLRAEHRRISSQHRQLDALYGFVTEAVGRGSLPDAHTAFQRFRDAWDAHTGLEDGFYFPALRGLRPALEERLEALCDDHARFREALEEVERAFVREELEAAAAALERVVFAISEHERSEEDLVGEIAPKGGNGG